MTPPAMTARRPYIVLIDQHRHLHTHDIALPNIAHPLYPTPFLLFPLPSNAAVPTQPSRDDLVAVTSVVVAVRYVVVDSNYSRLTLSRVRLKDKRGWQGERFCYQRQGQGEFAADRAFCLTQPKSTREAKGRLTNYGRGKEADIAEEVERVEVWP
jgi:hypothetical protein